MGPLNIILLLAIHYRWAQIYYICYLWVGPPAYNIIIGPHILSIMYGCTYTQQSVNLYFRPWAMNCLLILDILQFDIHKNSYHLLNNRRGGDNTDIPNQSNAITNEGQQVGGQRGTIPGSNATGLNISTTVRTTFIKINQKLFADF